MRSTKGRITVAGAWLVLAGTPLLAQQPAPSGTRPMPMGGMPMMECPMMSAMMHGPAAALQSGAALKLTAQQRTRLEALQRQVDAASKPSMDSMQAIHTQLIALGERPQLDEAAARAAFDRMGRVHTRDGADDAARLARGGDDPHAGPARLARGDREAADAETGLDADTAECR